MQRILQIKHIQGYVFYFYFEATLCFLRVSVKFLVLLNLDKIDSDFLLWGLLNAVKIDVHRPYLHIMMILKPITEIFVCEEKRDLDEQILMLHMIGKKQF